MAARKTAAKKTTPAPNNVEYYYTFDDDSLEAAVSDGGVNDLKSVYNMAEKLHVQSGDSESKLYIYKVERLPVKTIKTTVEIT